MNPQANNFYESKPEPNRSCLLALKSIILNFDSEISEGWKYRMPCFSFRSKHFCYLWTDKKTNNPYVLFVDGGKLEHPLLTKGNRKRMKVMNINTNTDIPIDELHSILDFFINLRK